MKFLPDSDSVTSFIEVSLDIMQQECFQAYQVMCRQMEGSAILLIISDESIVLHFHNCHVDMLITTEQNSPAFQVSTGVPTILALVDGRSTLLESVLSVEVTLKGEIAEIAQFYAALRTYLRGAVRCPSFPRLLDHFRDVNDQRLKIPP